MLALTEDAINLSVVMSVNLLRPEIPVIARAVDPEIASRMADFDPGGAVINPYERYGNYLVLALQKPTVYQLVNWLIAPPGTPMHRATEGLTDGTWVVAGRGTFAEEVTLDLTRSGLNVRVVDPHVINPDISDAVGMVAGDDSDVMNLAIAAKARLTKPEIWLSVRQTSAKTAKTLQAFAADSVFSPQRVGLPGDDGPDRGPRRSGTSSSTPCTSRRPGRRTCATTCSMPWEANPPPPSGRWNWCRSQPPRRWSGPWPTGRFG